MKQYDNQMQSAVLRVWRANPEMTVAEAVFFVLNNGVTYEN